MRHFHKREFQKQILISFLIFFFLFYGNIYCKEHYLLNKNENQEIITVQLYLDPINGYLNIKDNNNFTIDNNCTFINYPCKNFDQIFFGEFNLQNNQLVSWIINLLNNYENLPYYNNLTSFESVTSHVTIRNYYSINFKEITISKENSGTFLSNNAIGFDIDFINLNIKYLGIWGNNEKSQSFLIRFTNCKIEMGVSILARTNFIFKNCIFEKSLSIMTTTYLLFENCKFKNTYLTIELKTIQSPVIVINSCNFYNSIIMNSFSTDTTEGTVILENNLFEFYSFNEFLQNNINFNKNYKNILLVIGFRKIEITKCKFISNFTISGILLNCEYCDSIINESNFTKLYTHKYGGAIYSNGFINYEIKYSNFIENISELGGGAISIQNYKPITISDCNFYNNTQLNNLLYKEETTNNFKWIGGGAIYIINMQQYNSKFYLKNNIFKYNKAESLGGAILYLNCIYFLNENNLFEENYSGFSGGAIAVTSLQNLDRTNNPCYIFNNYLIIKNNFAKEFGGGIFTDRCTLNFDPNLEFKDNIAGWLGGGIYTIMNKKGDYYKLNDFNIKNNYILNSNNIKDIKYKTLQNIAGYPTKMLIFKKEKDNILKLQSSPGQLISLLISFLDEFNNNVTISNMNNYFSFNIHNPQDVKITNLLFLNNTNNNYISFQFLIFPTTYNLPIEDDYSQLQFQLTNKLIPLKEIELSEYLNFTMSSCDIGQTLSSRVNDQNIVIYYCSNTLTILLSVAIPIGIIFIFILIITILLARKLRQVIRENRRKANAERELTKKLIEFEEKYLDLDVDSNRLFKHWIINAEDLKIESKIGEGGSGRVFRARWKTNEVALKTIKLNNEELQSDFFENEASLLSSLRHPNIVTFYGICISDNLKFIVTEYMNGGSLENLLKECKTKKKTLSLKQKLSILLDVSTGMSYLNELNPPIIHRDLKPANILLTKDLSTKITDFGLSKKIVGSKTDSGDGLSNTSQFGTLFYMPPEITFGTHYNEKCDVYSFAVIMWQILFEELVLFNPDYINDLKISLFMSTEEKMSYSSLKIENPLLTAKLVSEGLRLPIPKLLNNVNNALTVEEEKKLFIWMTNFMDGEDLEEAIIFKVLLNYFKLIDSCWKQDYNQRPSFSFISKQLNELLSQVDNVHYYK
ncbi:hypothetical protein ABK040_001002 [Willaertia magna]